MNLYNAIDRNWIEYDRGGREGRCLIDIVENLYPKPDVYRVMNELAKAVIRKFPDRYDYVAENMVGNHGVLLMFNDDPITTKQDVLELVREAQID